MEDDFNWSEVIQNLGQHLRSERMSVQELANKANVHRKTIDRLLRGETIQIDNLGKIEDALGTRLTGSKEQPQASVTTPVSEFGLEKFNRTIPDHYIGRFFMFRRSFDYSDGVVCSLLEISRDAETGYGEFCETQRNESRTGRKFHYDFLGPINHVASAGATQLVSIDDGFIRIITLGRPYEEIGKNDERSLHMRGILHTLNEKRDLGCYPVATPLHLRCTKMSPAEAIEKERIGSFPVDDIWLPGIDDELTRVFEKFFESSA